MSWRLPRKEWEAGKKTKNKKLFLKLVDDDVKDAPTLEATMPWLNAMACKVDAIVAHNAPFDMGVLAKCLRDYGVGWRPEADYACTCQMGRACYPNLSNHRLNTLCDYLHLDLDHHNAGSDSRACAELLLDYMRRGLNPERFLRRYDLAQRRTLRTASLFLTP